MIHETQQLSPRRLRRREAKTRLILETTLEILAIEGIEGLTIARLADALDLTPGALYRYFPSKDAILAECMLGVIGGIETMLTACRDRCDARSESPWLFPLAAADLYTRFAATFPSQFRLICLALASPHHLVNDEDAIRVVAIMGRIQSLVGDRLGQPARVMALWAALQGALQVQLGKLRRTAAGRRLVDYPIADMIVDALLVGWGAAPAELANARRLLNEINGNTPSGNDEVN